MGYLYPVTGKPLQRLIKSGLIVCLMLYGWDGGIMSGVLNTPQFDNQMKTKDIDTYTFIAAGFLLGSAAGALGAAYFAWSISRKNAILISCYVGLIGVLLQATAYSGAQMIIGRVVLGLGNGAISSLVPVLVHEMSVDESPNGRVQDVAGLMIISLGCVAIVSWIGFGVYKSPYVNGWRWLLASQGVFLVVALLVLSFVMDSPRWYYVKGRNAEGDESLCRLHGKPIDDVVVQRQRSEMLAAVRIESADTERLTLKKLFTFPDKTETKVPTRVWLSIILAQGGPMWGVQLMVYYGKSIFIALDLSHDTMAILQAAINTTVLVGSVSTYFTFERLGRRTILLSGSAVVMPALIIFTVLGTLPQAKMTGATKWAQVAMLFVYMLTMGGTWTNVVYLYSPEILPTRYRGQVNAVSNISTWFLAFVVVYAGPIAVTRSGVKAFVWFICTGAFVTYFAIFHMKETKDLTLDQIDLLWASESFRASNSNAQIVQAAEAEKSLKNQGENGESIHVDYL